MYQRSCGGIWVGRRHIGLVQGRYPIIDLTLGYGVGREVCIDLVCEASGDLEFLCIRGFGLVGS